MPPEQPYNPLDKQHLGVSVADALLQRDPIPLPPERFAGAGVYAIYYTGNFEPYKVIAEANRHDRFSQPLYVGKAVPRGRRKGGILSGDKQNRALSTRLVQHAKSIKEATNLDLDDFQCRYLVVDDIWIPLGESLLIERYAPLWNKLIDGFGNHDPGSGRRNQARSPWDVLHPGRPWAEKLRPSALTPKEIVESIPGDANLQGP